MKVVIVGAGGVADSLSRAVKSVGHEILQIYSRSEQSAIRLSEVLSCSYTDEIENIDRTADLYIVSIKDSALSEIAERLVVGRENGFWVHTAGSMSMNVFGDVDRGVMYPMQTFTRGKIVDFDSVPCFIEANNSVNLNKLRDFTKSISRSVYEMSEEQRRYLHLAAVFCCNFTNHCCAIAEYMLAKKDIPFEVMLPLLDETVRKLHSVEPKVAQTGPAVRYDKNVMAKHEALLKDEELLEKIYKLMSEDIHRFSKA